MTDDMAGSALRCCSCTMAALGVDVGSTTAKVVLADGALLRFSACVRHRGRPREVALELVRAAHAEGDVGPVGVTGSIGLTLADELAASTVHEVEAAVVATRAREPGTRVIVELGGQDAKLVFLGANDDAQMNDRCAAGTGATLDRIARRLGLDDLGSLRLSGDLRVAAKCGVFAERDAVNLVKAGASRSDVVSAVLRAIVVQNLAVLTRGRALRPPVLLLGGPFAHVPALSDAFREALGEEVRAPDHAELFAAIGAAICAETNPRHLRLRSVSTSRRAEEPLLERAENLPRRTTSPGAGAVHLGLDAGSTTSKAVLLSSRGEVLASSYGPSLGDPVADARARLAELAVSRPSIASFGVTGYGAPLVAAALGADTTVVETVAHATAAALEAPGTDVVVDVGGTDVKVMRIEGDRVVDFHLSNQCAAGLGAFLSTLAEDLGVAAHEIADAALSAARAPRFTVGCAVFLDTDRVTFQRDGFSRDELLAGVVRALVRNVWEFVVPVTPSSLGRAFLLTGGVHRNSAVASAQASYLRARVPGATVRVHPRPELCGAVGAALIARDRLVGASRFVGFSRQVSMRVVTGEQARCTRCEFGCARSVLSIARDSSEPVTLVVGNACERGADVDARGERSRAHAPDLFADEGERLFRPVLPAPRGELRVDAPVFGIPRVLGLYRCAPLLLHYLRALGVPDDRVVLSPPTTTALFHEGARRGAADPCFPAKLVLSHVDWLLRRRIDVLLMPTVTHARIAPHGVADTASCPIVAACGHTSFAALRRENLLASVRPFAPELCLADPARLDAQLYSAFAELLPITPELHRRAFEHAMAAQVELGRRLRLRGERLIARCKREGRVVAVVLARPYHVDPGVQHGVSTELAARGIAVMGLAALPTTDRDTLDLSTFAPHLTNSGDAEKLFGARVVAQTPNLVAVELTSFKCGQDAALAASLTDALDAARKPALRLSDLDEDRAVASLRVAIDTFAETVRAYERALPGARA